MSAQARMAVAVVALVVLSASAVSARQRPVPEVELAAVRWFNKAPGVAVWMLWPIMQAGQFLAPVVVALVLGFGWRRLSLATAIAATGWTAWLVAKLIKDFVGRERPALFLPDIVVREGTGGFGFVSGHAAVAAGLATVLIAVTPMWTRPLLGLIAVGAGLARIVYGVHLPADVSGGWAVGALLGVLAFTVLQAVAPTEVAELRLGRP